MQSVFFLDAFHTVMTITGALILIAGCLLGEYWRRYK